jgi:tetratricopeptide (TPR) repeat protein
VTFEGRYRKPLEPLVVMNLVWIVPPIPGKLPRLSGRAPLQSRMLNATVPLSVRRSWPPGHESTSHLALLQNAELTLRNAVTFFSALELLLYPFESTASFGNDLCPLRAQVRHCWWFVGPTIGLMQVGRLALADRYAYQSFLGLFIIVRWGVSDWARQRHLPPTAPPMVSIAVLLALSAVARRQTNYWSDNLTMWTRALQVIDNNLIAHDMVAGILAKEARRDEALDHYRWVLLANPTDPGGQRSYRYRRSTSWKPEEAIELYRNALGELTDPLEQAKAFQNMGYRLSRHGGYSPSSRMLPQSR